LSADALKIALTNTGWLIRKMIGMKEDDAVESILSEAEKYEAEIRENILFNNEVALPIMTSGNMGLIQHYRALLEQLYVPSPNATGFSNDTWAEIVNPQHLRRLSKFLSILGLGGPVSGDLIIHLLANLYVGGVHIPDDRLFQREVSAYLNSGAIKSNFLFNNLLLKKLPVYFNEVGATSAIRDDTTEIDAWSNDPVLYFLRKQIHVNSSNYNVRMVEEIIKAWVFNDQHFLKNVVPDDVYKSVDAQLLSRYSGAIKTLFLSLTVLDNKGLHLERLLSIADSELQKGLGNMQLADEVRIKITLICRIYRAIVRKYELVSSIDTKKDMVFQLAECCVKLRGLKETLLSPETSVPLEALYFKRHIAFGIPSVLGTYHEARFDALGEIFRTENRMTVLFEEIISMAGETPDTFTSKEYEGWIGCLEVMNSMLHFHAISNLQIDEVLTILKNDSLHFSQIIDLLKIWQKEMIWIVASLTRVIYDRVVHLLTVFPRIERVEILAHLDVEDPDYSTKAADIIIRDILSSITGLTEMDRFIDILIRTIGSRPDAGDDSFFSLPEKPSPEKEADFYVLARMPVREAMRLGPVIGSKAKNLVYLLNHNISVPAGIIFPARQKPRSSDSIESSDFPSLLKRAVKAVESVTGQLFGDAKKPLFLSVRSGSYMSMPGILATILYCGMNNEICGALASDIKKARFAWDSYRRFIEDYATAVFGLDEKIFTDILSGLMSEKAVTAMDGLTDEHLQLIVERYIGALSRLGLTIPQDVYEQLSESVKAIYASWYGEKSVQYRKAMGISGYWGTAVLMMQMVSGNQKGSGASVFFTRRPFSHEKGIYGDTREAATGDDLVRGRFISRPLAKMQESGSDESLETVDPGLFAMHAHLAEEIENAMGGLPQEVEITYTTGPGNRRTIDTLQTKRMEFQPGTIRTFEEICMMDSRKIGSGIGVYGGALSGIASFSDSRDELQEVRRKTGLPLILLRKFSSTEDVSLMPYVDGIITAAGGATSHAAILAQKFGLTAVVGCFDMKIDFDKDSRFFAKIGNTIVKEGGFISIDGYSGHVYSGICGDKQRGPINKSGDR
jgi:pyruvate,orthophosphate dikinase